MLLLSQRSLFLIKQGPNPKFLWGKLLWYHFGIKITLSAFLTKLTSQRTLTLTQTLKIQIHVLSEANRVLLESSIQRKQLFWSSHFFLIGFAVCLNIEKQCIQTTMCRPKLWVILILSSPFPDLSYLKKNLNMVSECRFFKSWYASSV